MSGSQGLELLGLREYYDICSGTPIGWAPQSMPHIDHELQTKNRLGIFMPEKVATSFDSPSGLVRF